MRIRITFYFGNGASYSYVEDVSQSDLDNGYKPELGDWINPTDSDGVGWQESLSQSDYMPYDWTLYGLVRLTAVEETTKP